MFSNSLTPKYIYIDVIIDAFVNAGFAGKDAKSRLKVNAFFL